MNTNEKMESKLRSSKRYNKHLIFNIFSYYKFQSIDTLNTRHS